MIGSDEFVVMDKNWNCVFVSRSKAGVSAYMDACKRLGFSALSDDQLDATREEIHRAVWRGEKLSA